MFVTAASSNHFKSLKQFIRSLNGVPVIVYDIGLSSTEAAEIKGFPVQYRLFDWSKVPEWGLLSAPNAGSYVWKPVIIHEVFQEGHELLIWCDSGNVVTDIKALENIVQTHGIYTGTSCGNLYTFTHDLCLNSFELSLSEKSYAMRNAACVGFSRSFPKSQSFINDWKLYSLNQDIIQDPSVNFPKNNTYISELINGSSTGRHHRRDQSILSCLFYKYKLMNCPDGIGHLTHRDCD